MECCEINLSAAESENKRGAGGWCEGRGGVLEARRHSALGDAIRRNTCHVILMSLVTRGCNPLTPGIFY